MQCFECGTAENLHHHHVVPRSLGGTKTIPLCGLCHGLVHSRDVMSTGALTSKAMKAKRANGEYTGGRVSYGYSVGADGVTLVPNPAEIEVILCAQELRRDGHSLRGISAELAAQGMVTRTGRAFSGQGVSDLLAQRGMVARNGKPFAAQSVSDILNAKPLSQRAIAAELAERGMLTRNGRMFDQKAIPTLLAVNVEGVA
jgi:hypothetical protein